LLLVYNHRHGYLLKKLLNLKKKNFDFDFDFDFDFFFFNSL
jgi:hypothetical protein